MSKPWIVHLQYSDGHEERFAVVSEMGVEIQSDWVLMSLHSPLGHAKATTKGLLWYSVTPDA
jgi:hypothetical protein